MTSLSPTNLPPDKQREMLRQMLTIRRFEERASADYLAGKIYGVVHCYIGEEAVAVGVCSALDTRRPDHLDASRPRPLHRQGRRPQPHDGRAVRPADRLLQGQGRLDAHRRFRHRHARRQRHRRGRHLDRHRRRARGADGGQGRRRGVVLRRRRVECRAVPRMPQHRGDLEAADALCLREQHVRGADRRRRRRTRCRDVAGRAAGYGIPGVVVDGNDVFAVHQAASAAAERARSGAGPTPDRVQDLPLARPYRAPRPARSARPRRRSRPGSERTRSPAGAAAAGTRANSTMPGCRRSRARSWARSRPRSPSPRRARSRCPSRRPTTCSRPDARTGRCES